MSDTAVKPEGSGPDIVPERAASGGDARPGTAQQPDKGAALSALPEGDRLAGGGTTWSVMRRMARSYLKPHSKRLAVALVTMVILAATTGALPFLFQMTVDEVFVAQRRDMLYLLPAAVVGIMLVRSAASFLSSVTLNYVGQRAVADVQTSLYAHLVHSDLGWLSKEHSGRYVASFMADAMRIREAIAKTIVALVKDSLQLIALIGAMFYFDWVLAVMAIVILPIVARLVRTLSKRMRKSTTHSLEGTSDLTKLLSETLAGIRTVKAYRQEEPQIGRARAAIDHVLEHTMKGIRARAAAAPITEALTGFAFAGVILYAGYQGIEGNMTAGVFLGFMSSMMLAYQPLKSVATLQTALQEGVTAASRLFALLDRAPEIVDAPEAKPLAVKQGTIRFDNVSFSYGDDIPALRGIDLEVPAGTSAALVGPSGAGKSTILNLIPRFFDISGGSLTIDGQDVRDVTMSSLRGAVALVTQEPFLFDDTVAANIAFGMPEASREEIEAAARNAAAHEFIMQLPQGYDTIVGEAGIKLSGGQRQRIAIARAMLQDAPILLLDEATSALDTESERQVQAALAKLMKGRTTLIIAHRLSTIRDADRIHVIDAGSIVERGTHDELMARGGLYARLQRTQFAQETGQVPETREEG